MRHRLLAALGCVALLPVAAWGAAPPPVASCDSFRLVNQTPTRVRITLFDIRDQARQRPADLGWLEACSARDWVRFAPIYPAVPKPVIGFLCGNTVYVSARPADNPSFSPKDAWTDISPRQQDIRRTPLAYSDAQEKWLHAGADGKFIWSRRADEWDPRSATPRPLYCEPGSRPVLPLPPPPPDAGKTPMAFGNYSGQYVLVTFGIGDRVLGKEVCVAPSNKDRINILVDEPAPVYHVVVWRVGTSCSGPRAAAVSAEVPTRPGYTTLGFAGSYIYWP